VHALGLERIYKASSERRDPRNPLAGWPDRAVRVRPRSWDSAWRATPHAIWTP